MLQLPLSQHMLEVVGGGSRPLLHFPMCINSLLIPGLTRAHPAPKKVTKTLKGLGRGVAGRVSQYHLAIPPSTKEAGIQERSCRIRRIPQQLLYPQPFLFLYSLFLGSTL